jgi:hypothetical protein
MGLFDIFKKKQPQRQEEDNSLPLIISDRSFSAPAVSPTIPNPAPVPAAPPKNPPQPISDNFKEGAPIEEAVPKKTAVPRKKAAGDESLGGLTRSEFVKFKKLLKNKLDETADFDKSVKIIKESLSEEDFSLFDTYLKTQFNKEKEFQKRQKGLAANNPATTGLIRWVYNPEEEGECQICKELASRDTGHGPGIYTVDELPPIPHPGCWCKQSPIMRPMEEVSKEIFEKYFGEEALSKPVPKWEPPEGTLVNPEIDN